jgi:hypothetical protein
MWGGVFAAESYSQFLKLPIGVIEDTFCGLVKRDGSNPGPWDTKRSALTTIIDFILSCLRLPKFNIDDNFANFSYKISPSYNTCLS